MNIDPVQIIYSGLRPKVEKAVLAANELLHNEDFYDRIAKQYKFDGADVAPSKIAELMQNAGILMKVELYYALSPVKNIDGFDDPSQPNIIHMNIWKIDRPVESLCNTLIHACVHGVNARYSQYSFGHGDRTLAGKEETAPYKIGWLAQIMLSGGNTSFLRLEHDTLRPSSLITDRLAFNLVA